MRIITSLCIDESGHSDKVFYPMISKQDSQSRRNVYWICATVLMASSIKCNPNIEHIVYTNDNTEINISGVNIKKKLNKIGVDVRYLPFKYFKIPDNLSVRYKNAYYKLDAIKKIGDLKNDYNILLDNDCLVVNKFSSFKPYFQEKSILLLDIYERKDPYDSCPHGLSRADMGKVYKSIDKHYPNKFPIWFGGEFLGGTSNSFKIISENLQNLFIRILMETEKNNYTFNNGWTVLDGDELLTSFVYNENLLKWENANNIIKRVWTLDNVNNVNKNDLDLFIWHLPAEKEVGFELLFENVINKYSYFWKIAQDDFAKYLGQFVGVPKRSFKHKFQLEYKPRIKKYSRRINQVLKKYIFSN